MTANSELPWSILLPKPGIGPSNGSPADCGVIDAKGRVIGEFWLECPGPGGNDDLGANARGNAELTVLAVNGQGALVAALRAILFQVAQGKVLERDACITQAKEALSAVGVES